MPYLASFVIILAALLANVRARFIAVVFAGVLMNFSVIALNGGMPYSKNSLGKHDSTKKAANGLHIPENERTRLEFLDDWIALPRPYPQPSIGSPGDMVISIGLLLFIQQAMRKGPEREREEDLRLAEAAGVCNRHV
ncbi:MAG: DUF5317 domain-containing protein [Chloroflexi bacterium]|nr:DUF5317 domain-containing protein [Chloroflexota bacterium]